MTHRDAMIAHARKRIREAEEAGDARAAWVWRVVLEVWEDTP